jgi:hypothetical protein
MFSPARGEVGSGPMHCVLPRAVQIAHVHDVEASSFEKKDVQHVDIAQLAVADVNERWHAPRKDFSMAQLSETQKAVLEKPDARLALVKGTN